MKIDLTKMLYNGLYKLPIKGDIIIPKNMLNKTSIKDITPIKVEGIIYDNNGEYELDIRINGIMTLLCARTLKKVNRQFDIQIDEIIDENSDNSLEIIQNSLDIFPIVWQNILVDVPLRVLAPDAKEEPISGDGWRLITEDTDEEEIDPRLAKLKDYIKE